MSVEVVRRPWAVKPMRDEAPGWDSPDRPTSTLAPEVIDLATSWRMRALTRATSSIEVSVGSQSSSRMARR